MEHEFKPEDLINWGELSRLLSGSRQTVRKNSIPKKHESSVERLKELIKQWDHERCESNNG